MSTFRVCSLVTGEAVPQVIASGLTLEAARRKARAEFYSAPFGGENMAETVTANRYEARSRSADWGFSFYVESEEAKEIAAVSQAFETLREILGLEGADPENGRFLLSDIETDLKRVLSGKAGVTDGEPWIAYS